MAEQGIKQYDFGKVTYNTSSLGNIKIIKVENHLNPDLFNGTVIFPAQIDGGPIAIIGEKAFKDFSCDELVLPIGTTLLFGAFEDSKIKKIHIPGIEAIPTECFKNSWLEELADSSSVAFIGNGAFAGTANLKYFKWFEKAACIPLNCFQHSGIRKIEGIQDVKIIQEGAFEDSKLEEIALTDSVFLNQECFANSSLKRIGSLNGGGDLKLPTSAINGCGIVDVSDFDIVNLRKIKLSDPKIKLKTGFDTVIVNGKDYLE